MKNNHSNALRVRAFALSGAVIYRVCLFYYAFMIGGILIWAPLAHIFPVLASSHWYITIPVILLFFVFFAHLLSCFFTVILELDQITLRWWGISIRSIPVTDFKLFCAVGNGREDVLCFSCLSVSEMALLQEKRLLKNPVQKPSVPFRKQQNHWEESFTQEYLNYLRAHSFNLITNSKIIMLKMQPELQYLLQQMYPRLPYRNFTGVISPYTPRFSFTRKDEAVCFAPQLYRYFVKMDTDGIHLVSKKEEISFIPAEQIKTAVRIDVFKAYERNSPHHLPLIFISCSTEEELASQLTRCICREIYEMVPRQPALLAMMVARNKALRWRLKDQDCCVLHYTEETIKAIQELYPKIHLNNISENWLYNVGN